MHAQLKHTLKNPTSRKNSWKIIHCRQFCFLLNYIYIESVFLEFIALHRKEFNYNNVSCFDCSFLFFFCSFNGHLLANMPSLGGTLPRQQHHPVSISGLSIIPPPTFLSGSVMGHHTLRRQSSHDMDHQMPRILSRNAANVQYYYGWQEIPTLMSPITSQAPLMFTPICSASNSMRLPSITTPTTTSNENQNVGGNGPGNRTYCF